MVVGRVSEQTTPYTMGPTKNKMEQKQPTEPEKIIEGQMQCSLCESYRLQLLFVRSNTKDRTILTLLCLNCGVVLHQPIKEE